MVPFRTFRGHVNHASTPPMPARASAIRILGAPLERGALLDEVLPVFDPCVEVRESRECLLFLADLPGLCLDDVEVLLSQDLLVITGEREKVPLGDDEFLFIRERHFGSFSCSFPLPWGLDGARATANMHDGVLAVRLPKTHRDPPRRLPISPGASCAGRPPTPPPPPGSSPRSPGPPRPRPS